MGLISGDASTCPLCKSPRLHYLEMGFLGDFGFWRVAVFQNFRLYAYCDYVLFLDVFMSTLAFESQCLS